jgi:branched-chain amino acid transport system ATP-binding protein
MSSNQESTDDIVLRAESLTAGYVGQPVVRELNITVRKGEVVCLLGPNGAGKTTTLMTLTGMLPLMSGTIEMFGRVGQEPLYKRAKSGLSFVTEERSIIRSLSLADNVRLAGVPLERVTDLFPELKTRISTRAGLLSGGEQQMLTLGRALARQPRLLLADELSLGLAPLIVDRLLAAVRAHADDRGTGVLMVEQHARKALKYADRAIVMQRGRAVLELSGEEARRRIGEIEESYLSGTAAEDVA